MKYLLILLISIFGILNSSAQNLQLAEKKVGNKISIICHNHSSKDFEITFTYNISGFNADKPSPIVQIVRANGEAEIVAFTGIAGVSGTYKMSYAYKEVREGTLPSVSLSKMDGIHVFSMNGCARCNYVIGNLQKNKVVFKNHNTDNSNADDLLMWKLLHKAGFKGNSLSMPVVVVDDKVYYNIPNLKVFLENLKR